jgi:hypothetical protein
MVINPGTRMVSCIEKMVQLLHLLMEVNLGTKMASVIV